jgi:DNA-binding response OmpR family regulator
VTFLTLRILIFGIRITNDMSLQADPSPPRLLICDDSNTERHALAHFLRANGFSVSEASDGDAAIVHVKNNSCDLVLLDLNMPGSDGFTVLGYLQQHHRAIPVILLSGMALSKIQHKIHALPTPELPPLLIKPIDPQQLLGLVDLQLSGELNSQGDSQMDSSSTASN